MGKHSRYHGEDITVKDSIQKLIQDRESLNHNLSNKDQTFELQLQNGVVKKLKEPEPL